MSNYGLFLGNFSAKREAFGVELRKITKKVKNLSNIVKILSKNVQNCRYFFLFSHRESYKLRTNYYFYWSKPSKSTKKRKIKSKKEVLLQKLTNQ